MIHDSTCSSSKNSSNGKLQVLLSECQGITSQDLSKFSSEYLSLQLSLSSIKETESRNLYSREKVYRSVDKLEDKLSLKLTEKKKRLKLLNELNRDYKEGEKSVTIYNRKILETKKQLDEKYEEKKLSEMSIEEKTALLKEETNGELKRLEGEICKLVCENEFLHSTRKKIEKNLEEFSAKRRLVSITLKEKSRQLKIRKEKIDLKKGDPERISLQETVFDTYVLNVSDQIAKKVTKTIQLSKFIELQDSSLSELNRHIKRIEKEIRQKDSRIVEYAKQRDSIDRNIRELDIIQSEISKRKYKLEQILRNKKTSLYLELKKTKGLKKDVADEQEKVVKVQNSIESITNSISKEVERIQNLVGQKETISEGKKRTNLKIREANLSIEMSISSYISREIKKKEMNKFYKRKSSEVKEIEEKITALAGSEKERKNLILVFKKERERLFREVSKIKQSFISLKGDIKMQKFINKELMKKYFNVNKQVKEKKKFYQLVKIDRNSYVKLIQDHSQTLSQVTDNKKILENEQEILQRKSLEKEKDAKKDERKVNDFVSLREDKKRKLSKLEKMKDDSERTIHEKENIIEKLNRAISEDEKDMVELKDEFKNKIEERNFNGILLMDRNDELCILLEKSNFQKEMLENGKCGLKKIDDQIKVLSSQTRGLLRDLIICNEKLPLVQSLIKEKENLEKEILKYKGINNEISEKLEDTSNERRHHFLKEQNHDKEEVLLTIRRIKRKINDKKERIIEKQLILKEITSSTDKLRKLAAGSRDFCFTLSSKLNGRKNDIDKKNNSIKSLFSELSISQANFVSFQIKNKQLKKNIESLKEKYKKGLPPSKEMLLRWERERKLEERREEHYKNYLFKKTEHSSNNEFATITRTTAMKRPNAYLPECQGELAIPKPYLCKPIFPTKNLNNKHYKKKGGKAKIVI